jgi:hypothetical protein
VRTAATFVALLIPARMTSMPIGRGATIANPACVETR